MTIEIKAAFTAEDLQAAYNLHYKKRHPIKSNLDLIFALCAFAIFIALMIADKFIFIESYWKVFWLIYSLIFVWLIVRRKYTLGKRMLKKQPHLMDHNVIKISDTHITTDAPGRHMTTEWSTITYAVLSPEMVLLYLNDFAFLFLPKHYFASEKDFNSIGDLVIKHVKHISK